jgi:hypothetical protein
MIQSKQDSRRGGLRPVQDGCLRGSHVANPHIRADEYGIQHSRCRNCGCELTRMPAFGRWYRTGLMG